jgi:hypothetical protein
MKRFCLILILLTGITSAYAQNKPFKKVAAELNRITDTYTGIYPYQQDKVLLKDYGLTYKDFPKDTEEHVYSESFSANKDSIDVFSLQEFYQQKIRKKLIELTSHNDFGKAGNEKLVTIFATKSADNKVYNFVYDENTGGSYQSRISYIYYVGQKGEQDQSLYNPDGYDTIIPIKTKTATRYLMMGENIGCNSCIGHYAKVVHYEKGLPVVDFECSLNTRIGFENVIEYNPASKTLYVHYLTDDLQTYCYCNEQDKNRADDGSNQDIIHQCSCTYKFNGVTFELASEKDEPVKE